MELLDDLRAQLPEAAVWSVDALVRNLQRMESILDRISETAEAVTAHH